MNEYPISVILLSYNQKDCLEAAVKSLLSQTYPASEIIICDDASSDGTQRIIERYAKLHPHLIRPILHDKNRGISANLNSGLEASKGEWITRLDGDDLYYPDKLKLEVEALDANPSAEIAYSNFYFFDQKTKRKTVWQQNHATCPTGDVFSKVFSRTFPRNTLFRNELISRKLLEKTGGYDEQLPLYEDWDLRIRVTSEALVACNPSPQLEYRIHDKGIHHANFSAHFRAQEYIVGKNKHLLKRLADSDRTKALQTIERHLKKSKIRLCLKNGIMERLTLIPQIFNLILDQPRDLGIYKLGIKTVLPRALWKRA